MAGHSGLFLPHTFQHPLAGPRTSPVQFPFTPPNIPAAQHPLPQHLACKPLRRALLSTSDRSHTKITIAVDRLGPNERLRTLKCSSTLWNNLCLYADPIGGGVVTPPGSPMDFIHTNHLPRIYPYPAAQQQARAIGALWGWFLKHHYSADEQVVTSEDAIHAQVWAQLIDPVNLLIQTRYTNSIHDVDLVPFRWEGAIPKDIFPKWFHAVGAMHNDRGLHAAGHPDQALTRTLPHDAGNKLSRGIAEIKTFWAYKHTHLGSIFSSLTAQGGSGDFAWDSPKIPTLILKQIWGEITFYNAVGGFFTNGEQIFVYIKSGPTELTLSEIQAWNQNDVHQAIFGLTCAIIDMQHDVTNYEIIHSTLTRDKESNWPAQ